jgi:enoyl-CoA hydratase
VSDSILLDDPAPGVRRITLNRPDNLNGLTPSMYTGLISMLDEIGRDPTVRVVILTGTGRGFCSGHDGSTGEKTAWCPDGVAPAHYTLHFIKVLHELVAAFRNLPQPVIAAVNGSTAGMGYTLVLACDMAIAAKSAKFVNAFHNAGTGSEGGLSYMLPRAVGTQRAAELLLTARPVMADEAERIGLVLRTVPDEELMASALALAEEIKANAPLDVWVTKQNLIHNLNAGSLEQAVQFEARAIAMALTTKDAAEKRTARREKRPPVFSSQ